MINQLIHLAPLENKLMLTRVQQSKKINGGEKAVSFSTIPTQLYFILASPTARGNTKLGLWNH